MAKAVWARCGERITPRLSPDGTRVAVSIEDQQDDIWVWDFARETLTRVTFNPGADAYPAWTPDGRRLLFAATLDRQAGVFWQAADGTGSPERLTDRSNVFPYSVSPDGSRAVLRDGNPPYNLAVLSLGAERKTEPLIHTEFHELNAEISPDGRWLAYESDESGQREVMCDRSRMSMGDDGTYQVVAAQGHYGRRTDRNSSIWR